jgi:DNA-binding response OmpR family regulator
MFNALDSDRPRVLLVEDAVSVRKRIRILIEEACPGIEVEEAGSARTAIAAFEARAADAAVIDIHLKGQDGCTVLTYIKALRPGCLVIVLTAFGDPDHRAMCLGLGADFFFEKTTEFNRVSETLVEFFLRQSGHAS